METAGQLVGRSLDGLSRDYSTARTVPEHVDAPPVRQSLSRRTSADLEIVVGISRDAITYVGARDYRPKWATGSISSRDAYFIFEIVTRERPQHVAELGVSAGTSTTFLASLLADRVSGSRLSAFDERDHVYYEPTKPVGAAILDIFGSVPAHVTIHPNVRGDQVAAIVAPGERFDLLFLDANHIHPWPCLDILSVLDVLRPNSWIMLHDVRLPIMHPEKQHYGPLFLYQTWPGQKARPEGENTNIAAIRLFDSIQENTSALLGCLDIPWHANPSGEAWAAARRSLERRDAHASIILKRLLDRPRVAKQLKLSDCEFVVGGPARGLKLPLDFAQHPLVLTIGDPSEPPTSIEFTNMSPSDCNGIILSEILASGVLAGNLNVTLSIAGEDGATIAQRVTNIEGGRPGFALLLVPLEYRRPFKIEVSVSGNELVCDSHGSAVTFNSILLV